MSTDPRADAPRHILAINNDAAVLALYRDLLEEEGYRVSTQSMIERDFDAIRAYHPELIILDYMWAWEDNNWSLLQMMRMDPTLAPIPIVLCTAAVREVEPMTGRLSELGVRVVLKPFNIDDLLATLKEAQQSDEDGRRESSDGREGATPSAAQPR